MLADTLDYERSISQDQVSPTSDAFEFESSSESSSPSACWLLARLGHCVVTFLDDGIGAAPDFNASGEVIRLCHADLELAGSFVNNQKSVWTPSQACVWLGYS